MELSLQPRLVERTVFEAARQDSALRPHYERQFADCFDNRSTAQRDRAFAELHRRWFAELGLDRLIVDFAREFENMRDQVGRLVVAMAPGPSAQSSELYGISGSYTVVLLVTPLLLLDRPTFAYWASHEFLMIDDMLNPAFGHRSGQPLVGETNAAQVLATDRFAVLWAISVDARLERLKRLPDMVRPRRVQELAKAFSLGDQLTAAQLFDELWHRWAQSPPSQSKLISLARAGLGSNRTQQLDKRDTTKPPAGVLCPLCRFPTFDWMSSERDLGKLQAVIRADFPDWSPCEPICGRCAEVYRSYLHRRPIPTTLIAASSDAADSERSI